MAIAPAMKQGRPTSASAGSPACGSMGRALGAWLLLALLPHARSDHSGNCPLCCAVTPDANGHVDYPSGETSVPDEAFNSCHSLVSITLPSGVTSIGRAAFVYCHSLVSVTLPSSLTSIGSSAFASAPLVSITLPSSLTYIGSSAFSNALRNEALVSITLPSSLTYIGSYAFRGCNSLASVTLPSGLTSIGSGAFHCCGALASVTLPSGLTSIGSGAFRSCGALASITLPSSLTSIGSSAFQSCGALASVTLPSGLTSIGDQAFNGCSNLGLVHVPAGCSVGSLAFSSTAAPAPGYVLGLPPAPPQPPPGLPAAPPPSPLSCGPGTSVNAATNQCEIPCDDSSGRRMVDEIPDESSDELPTARDPRLREVSTYLKRHPHLDEATVRHLVSLGRSQFEQHFWEPAFA